LVKASESQKEAALDEATVKEVTGGDSISARFLFKEFFEFRPQFKIWLATNHRPTIQGTDDAIWRRVRLIPFNQQFTGKQRDPKLRQKLEAELSGILAWALRGCLEWQRMGLGMWRKPQSLIGRSRITMDASWTNAVPAVRVMRPLAASFSIAMLSGVAA